jgi:hypothetical protein
LIKKQEEMVKKLHDKQQGLLKEELRLQMLKGVSKFKTPNTTTNRMRTSINFNTDASRGSLPPFNTGVFSTKSGRSNITSPFATRNMENDPMQRNSMPNGFNNGMGC